MKRSKLHRGISSSVPLLFTPGPLTTSPTVKSAMQVDLGSRDPAFIRVVSEILRELLKLGGVCSPSHECVLTPGSGTFGVESVLGSTVPMNGKLLVGVNGSYGERMVKIAQMLNIPLANPVLFPEDRAVNVDSLLSAAATDPSITSVAVVHHETTAGVLNDIHSIGLGLSRLPHKPTFIVDSMSAFGKFFGALDRHPALANPQQNTPLLHVFS